MKKVFLAGSRKFYLEINNLAEVLAQNGLVPLLPGKDKEKNDELSQKKALERAFQQIKEAEVVYIFTKDGYVGETVIAEVAFAAALKKHIFASEVTCSVIVNGMVEKIIAPEDILQVLK